MNDRKGKPFLPSLSAVLLMVAGILVATQILRTGDGWLLLFSIIQLGLIAWLAAQLLERFRK